MIHSYGQRLLLLLGTSALLAAGCGSDDAPPGQGTITPPDPGITPGGELPPDTGLPPLPVMPRVNAAVRGNTVTITFDPVAGAKDYRVYALPNKADIKTNADGSLANIENATYRCAGERAAPRMKVDGDAGSGAGQAPDYIAVETRTDKQDVSGYKRSLAEATLGYAFPATGPDVVPVFAVGDPAANADNYANGVRSGETRSKLYVTDKASRVDTGWRDDGVSFYAPTSSKACGGTEPVVVHETDVKESSGISRLFYASSGEVNARGAGTAAFSLCATQVPGALPVMRANYLITSPAGVFGGEAGHDELVLGQERFDRVRCQSSTFGACANASQTPWEVHWSGITDKTLLVVEALDAPCPFQGLLAANPVAAKPVSPDDNEGNASLMNDRFFTIDELRATAPHGEVFLNGQGDAKSTPHPIARAAASVAPQPRPPMDFSSDFTGHPENFTEVLNGDGTANCGLTDDLRKKTGDQDTCDTAHRMTSPTYDALFFSVDNNRYSAGVTQGQLWTGYSGGKWRMTPKNVTATMSASAFLHVAMEASAFSTGRRYPQIIISQQDFMTAQWLLERTPEGNTNPNVASAMYFHPIDAGNGRHIMELEICHNRQWQVNNHCPWFLLENVDPAKADGVGAHNGHPELFDRLQDDRSTRFDLYVSTDKAYVFLDARPYACVDLGKRKAKHADGSPISPEPIPVPAGPATVVFGDVQYHAGAEAGYFENYSSFHLNHLLYDTARHFDYVGFKSNEQVPAWNEKAFPCITQMYDGGGAGTQTPEQGN